MWGSLHYNTLPHSHPESEKREGYTNNNAANDQTETDTFITLIIPEPNDSWSNLRSAWINREIGRPLCEFYSFCRHPTYHVVILSTILKISRHNVLLILPKQTFQNHIWHIEKLWWSSGNYLLFTPLLSWCRTKDSVAENKCITWSVNWDADNQWEHLIRVIDQSEAQTGDTWLIPWQ